MLALHIKLEQVLRPIGALNRSRQLQNSKIKHRFFFLLGVVLGVAVAIVQGPYSVLWILRGGSTGWICFSNYIL